MPREPMTVTLIENATMEKIINSSGTHTQYAITPNSGYVLHDNRNDVDEMDEEGNPTGNKILGYSEGDISVSVNYDFDTVVQGVDKGITVNKIGAFELYTLPRNVVPESEICDITDPDHEIM